MEEEEGTMREEEGGGVASQPHQVWVSQLCLHHRHCREIKANYMELYCRVQGLSTQALIALEYPNTLEQHRALAMHVCLES